MSTTWYACEFPETLWEITNEGAYLPKQVFNVDKTGLHWKRMPDQSCIRKEEKLMLGYKGVKDMLTLLFVAMLLIIWSWSLSQFIFHITKEPLKTWPRPLFLLCGRVSPKPEVHSPFSGLVFPPLNPGGTEILLGEGSPFQHSFTAQQCSRPLHFHGQLSSQCQSSVSAIKYYIAHPNCGPASCSDIQEILFTSPFSSGSKGEWWIRNNRATILEGVCNIYKAIKKKKMILLGMRLRPSTWMGFGRTLPAVCSQF